MWHRNGTPIPILTERSLDNGFIEATGSLDTYSKFVIQTIRKEASVSENILEHVESKFTMVRSTSLDTFKIHDYLSQDFNDMPIDDLTASDMTAYSCVSSANSMGPSVQSRTNFRIHYPPRSISVEPR